MYALAITRFIEGVTNLVGTDAIHRNHQWIAFQVFDVRGLQ
jgi:hypothetical protein